MQICIEGQFTVDLNDGLPNPLQNVVHGDVALIGELGVKVNSGPKNLKKFRPKKNSWNQKNQFHEKIFAQIPFFAI